MPSTKRPGGWCKDLSPLSKQDPIEDAFEEEVRHAGVYAGALDGGPMDFDRDVQEHLDRLGRSGPKECSTGTLVGVAAVAAGTAGLARRRKKAPGPRT